MDRGIPQATSRYGIVTATRQSKGISSPVETGHIAIEAPKDIRVVGILTRHKSKRSGQLLAQRD